MSSYWEKLKDPRWQRKRLEILERASFACEECGDSTKTLHAHHKIYRKGCEPWEYSNDDLSCLCDSCHETWHLLKNFLNELLVSLDEAGFREMLGYGQAIAMLAGRTPGTHIGSEHATKSFAKHVGLKPSQIAKLRDEDCWLNAADVLATLAAKKGKR